MWCLEKPCFSVFLHSTALYSLGLQISIALVVKNQSPLFDNKNNENQVEVDSSMHRRRALESMFEVRMYLYPHTVYGYKL